MALLDPVKLTTESALQVCLLRLIETVEDENSVLRRNQAVNHAGFTSRKNHALRDIMAITRVGNVDSADPVNKPLLVRLSSSLRENSELLKLHIGAVSEVSDIIVENLRKADSDGTYSRQLHLVRD